MKQQRQFSKYVILLVIAAGLFALIGLRPAYAESTYGDFTYEETENYVTLIGYTGSDAVVTVPTAINGKPVSYIGAHTFEDCEDLTCIIIRHHVSVNSQAFYNLPNLETIEFDCKKAGFGYLEDDTFTNCPALREVHLSEKVTDYDETYGDRYPMPVEEYTVDSANTVYSSDNGLLCDASGRRLVYFPSNTQDEDITVSGFTAIGPYAFAGLPNVKTLEISGPDPITLQDSPIGACDNLQELTIENISGKGYICLYGQSLTSVFVSGTGNAKVGFALNDNPHLDLEVEIGNGITHTGMSGDDHNSLIDFIFGKDVRYIKNEPLIDDDSDDGAQGFARNAKNFTVNENNPYFEVVGGILYSKNQKTLYACPAALDATNLSLPNGITTIGAGAFFYHNSLKKIALPESVTTIEDEAFYSDSILDIYIPASVKTIGDSACYDFSPPSLMTIRGIPGSYAQTYAQDNEYSFIASDELDEVIIPDEAEDSTWDGTSEKEITPEKTTYVVTTGDELAWIAKANNNGSVNFKGKIIKLAANINLDYHSWTPIGTEDEPFRGSFDGMKHTISCINPDEHSSYGGLFGVIEPGTYSAFKNLKITDFSNTSGEYVGAFAGRINAKKGENATLSNITVKGAINNASCAGGIVCQIESDMDDSLVKLKKCSATIDISVKENAGGIVESVNWSYDDLRNANVRIDSCSYKGTLSNIEANSGSFGGIIGTCGECTTSQVDVTLCAAKGTIREDCGGETSGISQAGGIIASADGKMAISKCVNKMNLGDGYAVGGIAATVSEHTTISECMNEGVISNNKMGGSAGNLVSTNGGTIQDCANIASSNNYWYSGGLIASNDGTVLRCYNIGARRNQEGPYNFFGALAFDNCEEGSFKYCYADAFTCVDNTLFDRDNGAAGSTSTSAFHSTEEMKSEGSYKTWDFGDVWEFDSDYCYGYPVLKNIEHLLTKHPDTSDDPDRNTITFTVVDQDGVEVEDAIVNYGSGVTMETGTTNSKGKTQLRYHSNSPGIKIEKEGYFTYEDPDFDPDEVREFTFRLVSESQAGDYDVLSCLVKYKGYGYEVMAENLTLNRSYTEESCDVSVKLCNPNAEYERIEIIQPDAKGEGHPIRVSDDGQFKDIPLSDFDVTSKKLHATALINGDKLRPIYVNVIDKGGAVHRTKINLTVLYCEETTSAEWHFGDDCSFDLDRDTPIVGSLHLELLDAELPLTVSCSEEEWELKVNLSDIGGDKDKKKRKGSKDLKDILDSTDSIVKKSELIQPYLREKNLKVSKGFDFDVSFFAYASGDMPLDFDKDINFKLYAVIKAATGSCSQVSVTPPVVVEWDLTGKFTTGVNGTINLRNKTEPKVYFDLDGEVDFNLFAGLGAAYIISAGVYGDINCGVKSQWFRYPKPEGIYEVYLEGSAGVAAHAGGSSIVELSLIKGKKYLFRRDLETGRITTGDKSGKTASSNSMKATLKAASAKTISTFDRSSYTNILDAWDGEKTSNATLQEDAYPDTAPTIMNVGGSLVMLFLSDDSQRDTNDKSTLMYSIYNKTQKTWSQPQAVWDDGTADFEFSAASTDANGYVIWNNSKASISDDMSYVDVMNNTEVAVARFDKTTGTFKNAANITNNNLYETQPTLSMNGSTPYAAWTTNDSNDIFRMSGTNSVYIANGGEGWSVAKAGDINGPIMQSSFGILRGAPAFAYMLADADDENTNALAAVEHYTGCCMDASGNVESFADGNVTNVCIGKINGADALLWTLSDGTIHTASSASAADQTAPAGFIGIIKQVITDPQNGDTAVLYTRSGSGNANAYMRIYDTADQSWSGETTLTDASSYVEKISGSFLDGKLVLSYNNRVVDLSSDDFLGTNSLCWENKTLASHLAVNNLDVNTYAVAPGSKVPVTVEISNKGNKKASSYRVIIRDASNTYIDKSISEAILPGAAITKDFEITLPANVAAGDLSVIVTDPANSTAYSDNTASTPIGGDEIYIDTKSYCIGDQYSISVSVRNEGLTAANGIIEVYDKETGDTLDEYEFKNLTREDIITYRVPLTMIDWTVSQDLNLGVRLVDGESVAGDHDRNLLFSTEVAEPVEAIRLNLKEATLTKDAPTVQLEASVIPESAANKSIKWWSKNENIATVDETGLVTAVSGGETLIYAESLDTGVLRSCKIISTLPVSGGGDEPYNPDDPDNPDNPDDPDDPDDPIDPYHPTGATKTLTVTSIDQLASTHPYSWDLDSYWYYKAENANTKSIALTFDEYTYLEDMFDWIYIYDGQGKEVGRYSENELAQATIQIPGNRFAIRLCSDSGVEYYGFRVSQLKELDENGNVIKTAKAKALPIKNSKITKIAPKVYTGKKITQPSLTVTYLDKRLYKDKQYSLTYKNNQKVGKATVTITGKGTFGGSVSKTFKITPKKAAISKATAGKKKVVVKMKTKVSSTGGTIYQIAYRVKGTSKWKYTTTKSKSKTIKKLKKGKRYQIKVRAYKPVSGTKYYGAWSAVKTTGKVK